MYAVCTDHFVSVPYILTRGGIFALFPFGFLENYSVWLRILFRKNAKHIAKKMLPFEIFYLSKLPPLLLSPPFEIVCVYAMYSLYKHIWISHCFNLLALWIIVLCSVSIMLLRWKSWKRENSSKNCDSRKHKHKWKLIAGSDSSNCTVQMLFTL